MSETLPFYSFAYNMLVTALRESRTREWLFFRFSVLVTATVRTSPIGEESSRADFLRPFILIPTQKTAIYVLVSDRSGPPDVLCHPWWRGYL